MSCPLSHIQNELVLKMTWLTIGFADLAEDLDEVVQNGVRLNHSWRALLILQQSVATSRTQPVRDRRGLATILPVLVALLLALEPRHESHAKAAFQTDLGAAISASIF